MIASKLYGGTIMSTKVNGAFGFKSINLALAVLVSASIFGVKASAEPQNMIKVDGSSTVYPITEAVAEDFHKARPDLHVTVAISGTGGGFKKFVAGEIDINDASRTIKEEEVVLAKKGKVDYLALPIAFDGLTIVVNKENTWTKTLTVDQLKKLWQPGSKVTTWKELDKAWPDRKIKLYGPGTASGTFDYFTEAINGKSGACRSDYTKSEDDNMLVQGVSGDKDSLGFFGYAYYLENNKKLTAVAIDNGKGAILPDEKSIGSGTYAPLSRTVYIYVAKKSLANKGVKDFVNFYLANVSKLVKEVGYIPLKPDAYTAGKKSFDQFVTQ